MPGLIISADPYAEAYANGDPVTTIHNQAGGGDFTGGLGCGFSSVAGVKKFTFNGSQNINFPALFDSSFDIAFTVICAIDPGALASWVIFMSGTGGWLSMNTGGGLFYFQPRFLGEGFQAYADNLGMQILSITYDGATLTYRCNGMEAQSSRTGNLSLSGTWKLGSHTDNGEPLTGSIGGLDIYNVAKTGAQVRALENAMAIKCSIPKHPFIGCPGNSLMAGGPAVTAEHTIPELVRVAYAGSDRIAVMNFGQGGRDTEYIELHNQIPAFFDSTRFSKQIMIFWEGRNSMTGTSADTPAQAYAAVKSFCNNRLAECPTLRIVLADITPADDVSGANEATRRAPYNALINADFGVSTSATNVYAANPGITHAHYCIRLSADTNMGQDGQQSNGTYYYDGLHFVDGGNDYMVTTYFKPAVDLVLAESDTDTTPPTLDTVTVSSDGTTTTGDFSETVTVGDFTEYSLHGGAAAISFTSATGSGDDSAWDFTATRVIYKAESLTLNFAGTGTVDAADNALATITGKAVVNNSAVVCAVPSSLVARPGDTKVRLTWAANTEPVFKDVQLYRATSSGGSYSLVATVAAGTTTYLDTGLTNGTPYFWKIKSRDTADNASALSSFVSATPAVSRGNSTPLARAFGSGFRF